MAITVISNIVPKNREANISNDAFFYVMDSSNIDFTVDGIQEDNTLIPSSIVNRKYIIKNISSLSIDFGSISGLQNNDIVRYNGSSFELYLDVSNSKTNGGTIVYNKSDTKNYVYNGTDWSLIGTDFTNVYGTENQIVATSNSTGVTLSFSPAIIIQQSVQTPIIIFAGNGITFGSVGNAIQLSGDIHITGKLIVDGEIISKTAFRGYTFDGDFEQITDLEIDTGEYE